MGEVVHLFDSHTHRSRMDMRHALGIIDTAANNARSERGITQAVIDALTYLSDRGLGRDSMLLFWTALGHEDPFQRFEKADAARNQIKRQALRGEGYLRSRAK